MRDGHPTLPAPVRSAAGQVTTLLSAEALAQRVRELGQQIGRDYSGNSLVLVCVLKGSFVFTADLARAIDGDFRIENEIDSSLPREVFNDYGKRHILDLNHWNRSVARARGLAKGRRYGGQHENQQEPEPAPSGDSVHGLFW